MFWICSKKVILKKIILKIACKFIELDKKTKSPTNYTHLGIWIVVRFFPLLGFPHLWISSVRRTRKGWHLSRLWGLRAMPLMVPASYRDVVAVQVCDLAADRDGVSANIDLDMLMPFWVNWITRICSIKCFTLGPKLMIPIWYQASPTWFPFLITTGPPESPWQESLPKLTRPVRNNFHDCSREVVF